MGEYRVRFRSCCQQLSTHELLRVRTWSIMLCISRLQQCTRHVQAVLGTSSPWWRAAAKVPFCLVNCLSRSHRAVLSCFSFPSVILQEWKRFVTDLSCSQLVYNRAFAWLKDLEHSTLV